MQFVKRMPGTYEGNVRSYHQDGLHTWCGDITLAGEAGHLPSLLPLLGGVPAEYTAMSPGAESVLPDLHSTTPVPVVWMAGGYPGHLLVSISEKSIL